MYYKLFKILIVLALFFFGGTVNSTNGYAQETREDSLRSTLRGAKRESAFEILYQLVREKIDTDLEAALTYADQAVEAAFHEGDSLNIVRANRAKGQVQFKLNDLDGAIASFDYALGVAKRNGIAEQAKFILNGLALAYTYKANYDKALDAHFQSLVIREDEGNKNEISIAYNNIGLVYYKLRDYDQALDYFQRSLIIKREVNDQYDMDRLLINIGLCYNALHDFSRAIQFLNEALETCGDSCNDQILTEGHLTLGLAYLDIEKTEEAEEHFKLSLTISRRNNDKRFELDNLYNLYRTSYSDGDTIGALDYLQKAELIIDSIDYNETKKEVYIALADLYTKQNNYKQASFYQGKYVKLYDSIYNDQMIRNLARVQTKYEERENIAIIASKEEALARQRKFNIAVAIIAILAGSLVFVLYRSNLVKKKVNKALSDAKETIEDQNKQLTSLNRNLEKMVDARTIELQVANEALKRVNDELDNFIYKTSHDIRGPLASLKGMCNVAIMDVKDPLALDYFQKLDATAEKLNTILTRLLIINQINNSSASHEPIDFDEMVDEVIILEKKRGLPPKLHIRKNIESNITFYSDKELVRIILENLIDNAIKFYNDSNRTDPFVEVKVEKEGNYLKVRVIDNGIGISQVNPDKIFQMFSRASERSGTGGIGLYLTKTATEKIGGQIDLKTTPEGYTEFFVKFSLSTSKMRREVIF